MSVSKLSEGSRSVRNALLLMAGLIVGSGCASPQTVKTCEANVNDPSWRSQYPIPEAVLDNETALMGFCASLNSRLIQQCVRLPDIEEIGENDNDYFCFPAID